MFSKRPIPISKEMYVTSGPAMFLARCFCLFPLTIQKKGNQLCLKVSALCTIYGWIFLTISTLLIYRGYLVDAFIDREKSIRMHTKSDFFITFIDETAIILLNFFVIFVTPFKYSVFSKYVQCFTAVDKIIPPTNLKSARKVSIIVMSIILIGIFHILLTDMLVSFRNAGKRSSSMFIVKCYGPFYFAYHILYAYHFSFWHLVTCILRRVTLLNDHLKTIDRSYSARKPVHIFKISAVLKTDKKNTIQVAKAERKIKNQNADINSDLIIKLMQVYGKLSDATEHLNELVGANNAITLMGVLFHLVVAPYIVVTNVTRQENDNFHTVIYSIWCLVNLSRLMFLAHPCHNCLLEVQKTKDLVCKLVISPNVDNQVKLQLHKFSAILELRKFEFSASGLSIIDRQTVSALLAAIVTHLVVVLQFAVNEK